MPYTKKTIFLPAASGGYGAQLKRMLETVLANTSTISNAEIATATDSVFDCSFTYYGAVIRIYNSSYNVYVSVDGSPAVDICDMDNFKSSNNFLVNILESATCGLAVSLQVQATGNYCEIYFSFIPAVAIMSDGTIKNMLLVGYAGASNNRTWLPVFIPHFAFANYKLCIPGTTGLHSLTISETIGNALSNVQGKTIASPLIIDSSVGEISQFEINGLPVYRIYTGPSYITTTIPGQYKVKVSDSEFVHFCTDALIRLS